MMKLVPDASRIFKISYTFWLAIFGVVSMVAPEIYYAVTGLDVSPFIRWVVPTLTFVSIAIVRFLLQPAGTVRNWIRIIAMAGALLAVGVFLGISTAQAGAVPETRKVQVQTATIPIATPFIAKWEGFRSCPYIPIKGDVPTIGYGSTRGVTMDTPCITKEQGQKLLSEEVYEYMVKFNRLMPQGAWEYLNAYINSAFTDLSVNVGWTGAAKSTAARRLSVGNIEGACYAITWFNKSGGRVIQGLVNRRSEARLLCRGDLSVI